MIRVSGSGRGHGTTINGSRRADFRANDVESISIDVGGGSDSVKILDVSLAGALEVELGDGYYNRAYLRGVDVGGATKIRGGTGFDSVRVLGSDLADLHIATGARADRVRIVDTAIAELELDTGSGWDSTVIAHSHVRGDANVDMGGGWDWLRVHRSAVGGHAQLDGGPGFFDWLDLSRSEFGSLETKSFLFGNRR